MSHYILAIDQGTSSTRSIIFDEHYAISGIAQQEIEQIFPKPAWVEHNPEEILQSCIKTARLAIKLGAPYWDAEANALICGLTRSSGANEIVRATLESVCYQTADLIKAMQDDWQKVDTSNNKNRTLLRVDGGMTASHWTMQYLANILDATIDRPSVLETTALGAAWLAGSYAGVWQDQDGFSQDWKMDKQFQSKMDSDTRKKKKQGWQNAVRRTLST